MGAMRQSTGTCRADYSAVSGQKGTHSDSLINPNPNPNPDPSTSSLCLLQDPNPRPNPYSPLNLTLSPLTLALTQALVTFASVKSASSVCSCT